MLAETIRGQRAEFGRWYRVWREGDDEAYRKWVNPALELRDTFSVHMPKDNRRVFSLARRVLTAAEIKQLTALGDDEDAVPEYLDK